MSKILKRAEKLLRASDRRRNRARADLSPNHMENQFIFRRRFVDREDLDVLLPMCRREYEPYNPLEFLWRKLMKWGGRLRQSVISGVRSALRTRGTGKTA